MRKHHLIVAACAFLMCAITVFFGIKIHNANENFLITELNEIDKLYYSAKESVPALSLMAVVIILPFLLVQIALSVYIHFKNKHPKVRNINLGLMTAMFIIMVFTILTMMNKSFFDFSQWGFIWICLGLIIIAFSGLSFIYRRREK
jgi:hypothetical protein